MVFRRPRSWRPRTGWSLSRANALASGSRVGGSPSLPPGEPWPECRLCGAKLTFFLQISPELGPWSGSLIELFCCTACQTEDTLTPELLRSVPDEPIDVPRRFLERYETNFRVLRFDAERCIPRLPIARRIQGFDLASRRAAPPVLFTGSPRWLEGNEWPSLLDGRSARWMFLFQILEDTEFPRDAGAPGQIELDLDWTTKGWKPKESTRNSYQCFIGNAVYVFGLADQPDLFYVKVQRP